jgi:hypothetical protein
MMGGGDRNLGDTGQRGVSLISGIAEGLRGTGALIVGSEVAGCKDGIDAADSARRVAAAEGGLVFVLAERDGLTSCELFFLDRLGPVADRAVVVVFDLSDGRTGEDSREGFGELVADVARVVCNLFVASREEVDESRAVGLQSPGTGWSLPAADVDVWAGSVGSWVALKMGVDLSSIVTFFFGGRGRC